MADSSAFFFHISVVVDPELFDPRGVGYRILSECELASQLASTSGENHSEVLMV
ncbi:hypothetical protein HUJ04_007757 [Dendroctonus ponderosae]|nr:hypothetical protein HUJ04_007757 [Dendroctonus ponderosae]KAH1025939.1 hypothetical protein HUJ05_010547 [Dendroctonus ponderosae]